MGDGPAIDPREGLWRGVFSRKSADRADKGHKSFREFLVADPDRLDISVHRLDGVPEADRTALGGRLAAQRSGAGEKRTFYGWLVVSVADVRAARVGDGGGERMDVRDTSSAADPTHADIVLPDAAKNRETKENCAKRLADMSEWRRR